MNLYYGPGTLLRIYIKDLISSYNNSVRRQHFDLQFKDKEIGQDYTIRRHNTIIWLQSPSSELLHSTHEQHWETSWASAQTFPLTSCSLLLFSHTLWDWTLQKEQYDIGCSLTTHCQFLNEPMKVSIWASYLFFQVNYKQNYSIFFSICKYY